jgi:hypothetical protein
MSKSLLLALVIIGKLVFSLLICIYFWNSTDLLSIKRLPIYIIVLAVLYIGMQMLTRKFSEVNKWWDWVYYFGLLSIMIPATFATKQYEQIYHLITDVGTIFLILPALVDGYFLIVHSSNKS